MVSLLLIYPFHKFTSSVSIGLNFGYIVEMDT
jgi:hypothetical protein